MEPLMLETLLHSPAGQDDCQEGEKEVTGKNSPVPNMAQRAVMQYLNLDDWKMAARLPSPTGELMLSRLLHHGWIESRGEKIRQSDSPRQGSRRCGRSLFEPSAGL